MSRNQRLVTVTRGVYRRLSELGGALNCPVKPKPRRETGLAQNHPADQGRGRNSGQMHDLSLGAPSVGDMGPTVALRAGVSECVTV